MKKPAAKPAPPALQLASVPPDCGPPSQRDPAGVAWNWAPQLEPNDFYLSLLSTVERHVATGQSFLEVGVGSGFLLTHLSRSRGCRCCGIDVLHNALQAARQTLSHWAGASSLLRASGFSMPFPDGTFDVVGSFGVIEHYDMQRMREMLLEHRRVCRPGGTVLVSTPNALDLAHLLRRRFLGRAYPYWPERSFSPWALARELRRAGLDPVATDGYGPFWGLRQLRQARPLTAVLHKIGLLDSRHRFWTTRVGSLFQGMTLIVARRPCTTQ